MVGLHGNSVGEPVSGPLRAIRIASTHLGLTVAKTLCFAVMSELLTPRVRCSW
ncbi:MAG: hypothetical protein ACJAYX_003782 [Planctomycetota bacterium]|jgi:hypothetical protein